MLGQRVLEQALDGAAQRTGAECGVRAFLCDEPARLVGQVDRHVLRDHAVAQVADHEMDDLDDLLLGQALENDNLVDTVEEFRPEQLLHLGHDATLDLLVGQALVRLRREAERLCLDDVARADVRRHDDDRVAEIDRATLAVGKATFLENLQQDVEDIRMRLLDLVEQHDRVRTLAHSLGELAALVESNVARRRTHETRNGVLLHVLGHVEADQRVLGVEQELGKRLRELGFAHARRAEEDERAGRAARVLQTRTRTADSLRQRRDGLVLADDALVQHAFHT